MGTTRYWLRTPIFLSLITTVLLPRQAKALDFRITDRQASSQPAACNALADALEKVVNGALFPPGADTGFLQAMGNASATATRGMGTDPISTWETLSVTTQIGAALGAGAQGGVSNGVRLGFTTFGLQGQYVAIPAETGNEWIH